MQETDKRPGVECFSVLTIDTVCRLLDLHDQATGFKTKDKFMAKRVRELPLARCVEMQRMIRGCEVLFEKLQSRISASMPPPQKRSNLMVPPSLVSATTSMINNTSADADMFSISLNSSSSGSSLSSCPSFEATLLERSDSSASSCSSCEAEKANYKRPQDGAKQVMGVSGRPEPSRSVDHLFLLADVAHGVLDSESSGRKRQRCDNCFDGISED